jgi:hypothetical protein
MQSQLDLVTLPPGKSRPLIDLANSETGKQSISVTNEKRRDQELKSLKD